MLLVRRRTQKHMKDDLIVLRIPGVQVTLPVTHIGIELDIPTNLLSIDEHRYAIKIRPSASIPSPKVGDFNGTPVLSLELTAKRPTKPQTLQIEFTQGFIEAWKLCWLRKAREHGVPKTLVAVREGQRWGG